MSTEDLRTAMADYANSLISSTEEYDRLQPFFDYFDKATSELRGELSAQKAINVPLLEQIQLLREQLADAEGALAVAEAGIRAFEPRVKRLEDERDAARRVIDAAVVQMGKETQDWQG